MTAMKLYYAPSACSLSPHIVAREAGLAVELVRVHLGSKKLDDGRDYREIHPVGVVPALELDDGTILTEGPAIVQYLADQRPEQELIALAGTPARYLHQSWLNFISTELHKSYSALFNAKAPEAWKAIVRTMIASRYEHVVRQLDGRSFLLGDHFTVADAYLFTVARWSKGVEVDLAPFPTLVAYLERIGDRASVQTALREEGLAGKAAK